MGASRGWERLRQAPGDHIDVQAQAFGRIGALSCRDPCAARAPGREPPPQSALTERHVAGRARIGGGPVMAVRINAEGTAVIAAAQRSRAASGTRSRPLPAGAHLAKRRPAGPVISTVRPPNSLRQTGRARWRPARMTIGGGTGMSVGGLCAITTDRLVRRGTQRRYRESPVSSNPRVDPRCQTPTDHWAPGEEPSVSLNPREASARPDAWVAVPARQTFGLDSRAARSFQRKKHRLGCGR
jgi:hypothetical protein